MNKIKERKKLYLAVKEALKLAIRDLDADIRYEQFINSNRTVWK